MAILLNPNGRPEPSPEIQRRLRAVHSGLGIRYVDGMHQWAVTKQWEDDDRRWEHVQSGGINPKDTYDIVGYLPPDCKPDEAPAFIERRMRTHTRDHIRNVFERLDRFNTGVTDDVVDQAIGEVLDEVDPSKSVDGVEIAVGVTEDVKPVAAPKKKVEKKKATRKKKTSKYLSD